MGEPVTPEPAPAVTAGPSRPAGATGGLSVAACLAVGDLRPAVDPRTGSVTRSRAGIGIAAPDATALETALRLAGAGGRVVALCVGPADLDPVLAEVAALGVETVRLPAPTPDPAVDERDLARALAAVVVERGPFDLVLCGDRSADRGTGAVPAFLAHELGAAQALGLVELSAVPGGGSVDGRSLRAVRRLDGGWRELLDVPLPAVCSLEGGLRLRRGSLAGALTAAAHGVTVHRPFRPPPHRLAPPTGDDPHVRLLALTGALDTREPPAVVGPRTADEAADRLLAFVERARPSRPGRPVPDDPGPGAGR
jgi:electron transfer flavoprotein beta subunit